MVHGNSRTIITIKETVVVIIRLIQDFTEFYLRKFVDILKQKLITDLAK